MTLMDYYYQPQVAAVVEYYNDYVWSRPTRACLGKDSYLAGPPRRDLGHRGNLVIRGCVAAGWMGCSSRPVRWE